MATRERAYIGIGAQLGDVASGQAVEPHLTVLNRLLEDHCNHRYATELDEIAPILRVDGDIWHWDVEGLERLRLARKKRYITIDVMMPRSRWEGASALEIRRYLAENLKAALHLMVDRLKKEHMEVDEVQLFRDFERVEEEFLQMV